MQIRTARIIIELFGVQATMDSVWIIVSWAINSAVMWLLVVIAKRWGMTHYLGTSIRCTGWTCSGFKLIRCVAKTTHQPPKAYHYRSRSFVFPRFNHYRVDWCYKAGQGCGQRAAYSFCRRMGYAKVSVYNKEEHVLATRAIGDQKLCFGSLCTGFGNITCYR